MIHNAQDWTTLNAGDPIEVTEPARAAYRATIDTKTADSRVLWILPEAGNRRAFDSREGVKIRAAAEPLT